MKTLKLFWQNHPNIASFLLLAVGMLVILTFSARHVGFTPGQWFTLGAATVVLAALCIWIISWEDEAEDAAVEQEQPPHQNRIGE
ncbi:MAG: hypothetical protein GXP37_08145 [Chloroflexi bacterium]|nr:hypothetical protein [Chloroflexota bacterium]